MIVTLVALNIIGNSLFGSARWFQTALVNIQPSEFAKIVLILVLGYYFAQHMHEMDKPKWTFISFFSMMGFRIWVLLQPNLSTSIVLVVLWAVLLWMAGLPIKYLIGYILAGLVMVAVTLPALIQLNVIQDYQLKRILNFIAPDPNARYGDIYNIQQALISIGSGGWFGEGYCHGTQGQLRFLKVRWLAFIFSSIANKLGLVDAILVIFLVGFIVYRCLSAARISPDS